MSKKGSGTTTPSYHESVKEMMAELKSNAMKIEENLEQNRKLVLVSQISKDFPQNSEVEGVDEIEENLKAEEVKSEIVENSPIVKTSTDDENQNDTNRESRSDAETSDVQKSDDDSAEKESIADEDEDSDDDEVGDPEKPPGENATRKIDPDHLLPFLHGWKREVVVRKGNSKVATQYEVSYVPPEIGQYRTREAKRKRTSKTDQEKYFTDFPSSELSIKNFNYVKRPLGMNNAAYEILRKGRPLSPVNGDDNKTEGAKASSYTGRRVSSYRELEESSGLLDDFSDEDDEEILCINGFETCMPICMQVSDGVLGLRAENKRRNKKRDPDTCCTPPLAEDSLWSGLDDDPLGILNDLGGRSSPTTPPPLRAVKLTPSETAEKILKCYSDVRQLASKRKFLSDPVLHEGLASHDVAIKKFKNYKDVKPLTKFVSSFGQNGNRYRKEATSRFSSSLIMKPAMDQLKNLPGISLTSVKNLKTCSMQCPGTGGAMPDIQCMNCKRLYHARCQGVSKQTRISKCRLCRSAPDHSWSGPIRATQNSIRIKLPMNAVNGKRPIVELVMLQNGKYQPIKFSNNIQVTETIPKSLFEQANGEQKTVYRVATQVPRVGSNTIYIAVNPIPKSKQQQPKQLSKQPQRPPSHSASTPPVSQTDQVSLLVKPDKGGKPVLLNVPRKIAVKVKPGTRLSFSASSDQKYVVVSNKMHPPVGVGSSHRASTSKSSSTSGISSQLQRPRAPSSVLSGALPPSVSLQPISKGESKIQSLNRKRPPVSVSINRASEPVDKARKTSAGGVLSSGEVVATTSKSIPTPCTPYCPGVTGFPELECVECKSLYHLKCVGIHQAALPKIKSCYKCKMCTQRKNSDPTTTTETAPPTVIDID